MSSTKENRIKSQEIANLLIEKLSKIPTLYLNLIKNEFRHGFYRELEYEENNKYNLIIGISLNPLDYPNTFDVKYLIKKENIANEYLFLHNLVSFEPMELYLYSDKSIDNLISYILHVDQAKHKLFK